MSNDKIVYKLTLEGYPNGCIIQTLKHLLEILESDLSAMSTGDIINIEKSEISQIELENMKEFERY